MIREEKSFDPLFDFFYGFLGIRPHSRFTTSQEILDELEKELEEPLKKLYKKLGVEPDTIVLGVVIRKGEALGGVYVIPGLEKTFSTEESARAALKDGQRLYCVDIKRIE